MSKMKRIVSFIMVAALLVTTCLTDGFGAWAAEGDGTTETTVETKVQAVWSNFNGADRLTFRLSKADYKDFGATERPVSKKVQEYDYGDKIEVTYADGSVKKLKEVWNLDAQYCNTWGYDSIYENSISMPVANGGQVVRVSIPAGTNFPSIAYTGATAWDKTEVNAGGTLQAKKNYRTTADVTFDCSNHTTTLRDSLEVYVWHQSTVTTPSKIELLGLDNERNILAIYPAVNDYPLPENQDGVWVNNSVNVSADVVQQFAYLNNVYLTNKNGETETLANVTESSYIHYNLWTTHKSFSVKINNASFCADSLTKVVFKKGCQIPGWDAKIATNTAGKSLKAYVLQEDFTYTYENSQWKLQEVAPSEVTVNQLVLGHNNLNVGFILSATDYANGINNNEAISVEKSQEYNFWDEIKIYYGDTSLSLKEAYNNASSKEAWYKMWTDPKWINISVKDVAEVTKIVVPEGTVFPSALYTNKGYIGKGGFKTTVTKTFVKTSKQYGETNGCYWEEQVIKDEETTISQISVESNKLIVTLSNHDYPDVKTVSSKSFYDADKLKAYKLLDYIELSTSAETKRLGEVLTNNAEDAAYINLWGREGTVGFTLKSEWDGTTIKKIAFLEGCEFPSYDSIINGAEKKSYYLKEKIAYKTSTSNVENTDWVIDYGKQDIDTSVTALDIVLPSNKDDTNAAFVKFTLSENDYTELSSEAINEKGKLNDYNLTEKVVLTKKDGSTVSLKDVQGQEAYYNLWNSPNCVAIRMQYNHTGDMFTRVTIPKGTEFPAYAYTNEDTKCLVGYVTTDEVVFEKVKGVWKLVKEHEDRDTSVEKIEVRAANENTGDDTRILVYLTEHDYKGVETNTSWNSKYTDYNFAEKIMLTTTSGVKTLADALNTTGAFSYNTWTESGCVGIPLASGYTKNNITQITIPKGTEFPAYEYTKQEGNPKTLISYVTTKDIIIKRMGDSTYEWQKINVADTETKIQNITVSNAGVTFQLTESDYTSTTNVSDKHMDFDYWKNVKVYKNSEAYSLEEWADSATISYGTNTVTIGKDATDLTCVVVPAKTTFPSLAYTSGTLAEAAGYCVNSEVVYKKQSDSSWKDISMGETYSSGDTNGDGEINSLDLITMAKYLNNGYGYNTHSLTYDSSLSDADNRGNVRKVIVGMSLHNYEKESDTMTYFASSDNTMDNFLNNYFLRHIGYYDYKEGDMKVGNYSIGTWFEGIFNHSWNMEAVSWMNLSDDFTVDRKNNMRYITSSIVVDKYGYVWDGMDTVETDTANGTLKDNHHAMGWPFPNATGDYGTTTYWDFNSNNDSWSTSLSNAKSENGIYKGTASGAKEVTFSISKTGIFDSKLIDTAHAPYLAFDLRMDSVQGTIKDIYVYYKTSKNDSFTEDKMVKVSELAPLTYDYSTAANEKADEAYAHMIYLPMYTQSSWYFKEENQVGIYGLKIAIVAEDGSTLSGNFGLNYVRPYYDTRYSDNNGNYISAVREYYDATGDTEFLQENMTKVRKAINFYLQMYDKTMQLIDLSYMQGHDGDKTKVYQGISNGYYDVLYTPVYDFAANMYFCKALENAAYLEKVIADKNIIVSGDATIKANKGRAKAQGIENVTYEQNSNSLNELAATVKARIQIYFWDESTNRFFAGYDQSNDKVDYGYLMWNLEAVELGIANADQAKAIAKWVNGETIIEGDKSTGEDLYSFGLAPRVTTKKGDSDYAKQNHIFNAFYKDALSTGTTRKFGEKQIQYGGANMYTSYYDLVNRVQNCGADNALERLNGIKTWYNGILDYYNENDVTPFNFYDTYYKNKTDYIAQSGAHSSDNGVVGIQGEFTESLLTLSAIPKGFFGIKQGADVLTVEPSLPSTMDRWKIENMEFANVLYDLSIYKDAIRIDSVRGDATDLTVKVILNCKDGQSVYVDGKKKNATVADGKATVTVPLADTLVEVK